MSKGCEIQPAIVWRMSEDLPITVPIRDRWTARSVSRKPVLELDEILIRV